MLDWLSVQLLRRCVNVSLLCFLFLTSSHLANAQATPSAKPSPPAPHVFPIMPIGSTRLVGVVRDQKGKPVVGIPVRLIWFWKMMEANANPISGFDRIGHAVLTDSTGHFTFSGLSPGQYKCTVISTPQWDQPGPYVPRIIPFSIRKSETVKHLHVVVSTGSLVSGRVVNGQTGKPMAGVFIGAGSIPVGGQLTNWESWPIASEGVTNAEGSYLIRVTSGNVYIGVGRMSSGTAFSQRISPSVQKVDVRPGQTASAPVLSVFLRPMIVFTGVNGQPIANVKVMIMPQHMSQVHYDLQDTTDSSGAIILDKPFTNGSFSIGHGGLFASGSYQWSPGQPLTIQTDGQTESMANGVGTVQLTAGSAAIVTGIVVDEAGKPISNAIVHIMQTDSKDYVMGDKLFMTDASGNFRKAINPHYRAGVFVRANGYNQVSVFGYDQFGGLSTQPPLSLVKGKTTDLGTIRLMRADGTVSGRVLDRYGKPMARVLAYVRGEKTFISSAMTDKQGRFCIPNVVAGDIIDLHLCLQGESPDSGEALSQSNQEMVIPDVQAGPIVHQIVWSPQT